MNRSPRNIGDGANGLFGQLAAEKKKATIALCLIAVMVFMWVRVLGKKEPASAESALTEQQTQLSSTSNPASKISFIELPKVKGRNDVLTRDFFAADNWRAFIGEGEKTANVVPRDSDEEVAKRIKDKLKLDAIGLGENPRAFINDTLLSVGDRLLVGDGVDTYECEVVGIEKDTVTIKCGKIKFTLELAQAIEVSN